MIHANCKFVDLDCCLLFSPPAEYYLHKTGMLFEFVMYDTSQNVHRQHSFPQGAAHPAGSWSRGLALHFRYWLGQ